MQRRKANARGRVMKNARGGRDATLREFKECDLGGDVEARGIAVVVRPQRPTSILLSDEFKSALRKRGRSSASRNATTRATAYPRPAPTGRRPAAPARNPPGAAGPAPQRRTAPAPPRTRSGRTRRVRPAVRPGSRPRAPGSRRAGTHPVVLADDNQGWHSDLGELGTQVVAGGKGGEEVAGDVWLKVGEGHESPRHVCVPGARVVGHHPPVKVLQRGGRPVAAEHPRRGGDGPRATALGKARGRRLRSGRSRERRRGIAQDEPAQQLRVAYGEVEGDEASGRVTKQDRALKPQRRAFGTARVSDRTTERSTPDGATTGRALRDFLHRSCGILRGMGLADLLTSGAVAGISSVLSLVVTGLLFPRVLEQWRERRSLAGTYKRYRDPIVLSARELAGRCAEIYDEFPTGYLDRELWTVADPFDLVNDATNIHFRKYKLTSTVYRLSAFLGWIELYRRDVAFLDAGKDGKNRRLDARLHDVQATLADGRWHEREERYEWRDGLLFREEQRAIGEAMIRGDGAGRTVIGYGAFCAGIEGSDAALVRAVRPALDFVSDTVGHHDFRKVRFREVAFHLVALVEELDGNRLPDHLRRWRDNVLGWRDPDRRWLDRGDPEIADGKTSAEAA